MNPGWQTPCKSMKKKVGGMSQPKISQALKMTVDFCHTPCLFFCLIRLFFCLSKTVWSSLGILVLSVGCFSFCGMKSCESWWLEFGIPYKPCMGLMEAEHMQANWTRKKTGGWKEHGKTPSFSGWWFQTFLIIIYTENLGNPILTNIFFEWVWNHQLGHHSDSEHFFWRKKNATSTKSQMLNVRYICLHFSPKLPKCI